MRVRTKGRVDRLVWGRCDSCGSFGRHRRLRGLGVRAALFDALFPGGPVRVCDRCRTEAGVA
jgi:hypothetical protein